MHLHTCARIRCTRPCHLWLSSLNASTHKVHGCAPILHQHRDALDLGHHHGVLAGNTTTLLQPFLQGEHNVMPVPVAVLSVAGFSC